LFSICSFFNSNCFFVLLSNERFFKHPLLPFAECRFSTNSGRHYKSHLHKQFSIGAIDKGKVWYEAAGESAVLQPGSLALINPEVLHSCNPIGDCTRSYYVLYLDVGWCLQVQQSLWKTESFQAVHTLLLKNAELYQRCITTMILLMTEGDVLSREQALFELVADVFRRCCSQGKAVANLCPQIRELKEILSTHLVAAISLTKVAADLQVNPYTLLRHFKKGTGITPHAYRLNCRIEQAKKMLRQGVEPAEVALECGFFDQSHLHRYYEVMGITKKNNKLKATVNGIKK
jgi:AraC-like DNA-binding protein